MHRYLDINVLDPAILCEQKPAVQAIKEIANQLRLIRRGLPCNTSNQTRAGLKLLEVLIENHWSDLQESLCGVPLPPKQRYCPECGHGYGQGPAAPQGASQPYCGPCAAWRREHGLHVPNGREG